MATHSNAGRVRLTTMMSMRRDTSAVLSSKFSVNTISQESHMEMEVSKRLSLRRFGEACSFRSSFIQEASTSSEGWMALCVGRREHSCVVCVCT